MSALPVGSWSLTKAVLQWWRDWSRRSSALELKCCGEEEVERMAKDLGLSASELRSVAKLAPGSADLLLRRMAALDLDRKEVSQTEPRTFQDLQRVCSMCRSHRRCKRDLAHDAADPAWQDYCPNAATLMALNALPCVRGVSGELPSYLSAAIYAARSAASDRDSPMSGIFGCGLSKNKAILAASKSGVFAIVANGGA